MAGGYFLSFSATQLPLGTWLDRYGPKKVILARRGFHADRLIACGLPASFLLIAINIIACNALSTWAGALWALYYVSCTLVALAQPAVGMAFAPALAGRALSAYNLLIFAGVFAVQWGIGLAVDGFRGLGLTEIQAFQSAMAVFLLCCVASYAFFLTAKSHNQPI